MNNVVQETTIGKFFRPWIYINTPDRISRKMEIWGYNPVCSSEDCAIRKDAEINQICVWNEKPKMHVDIHDITSPYLYDMYVHGTIYKK